jgi:hypothetical protein
MRRTRPRPRLFTPLALTVFATVGLWTLGIATAIIIAKV